MERNWDTIRELLLESESLKTDTALVLSNFDPERGHEVSYHVVLLEEAGLINASVTKTFDGGPTHFHVYRLTWQGHELLDAIRNESIWIKTKSSIIDKGGAMTFDLVKSVAIELAKAAMGI